MGLENTFEKENILGPSTAGLAQRMYTGKDLKPLYIMEKSYVLSCSVNQY
jgi:hypothetical protein